MIKSVLHLFKIHGKVIFGNPPVIVQDVLGKRPESFNAVYVVFGFFVHHVFRVINGEMFAQPLERIVAPKGVRVVDRTLPRLLSDDGHELLFGDMLYHSRIDLAIALQQAKYDVFAHGATSTLTFASTAKVALVHLHFAVQFASIKLGHMVDSFTQALVDARYCLVISAEIVGQAVGRLLLVEALDYGHFGTYFLKRLLFSTKLVSATHIPALGSVYLKRTTENTLLTSQKVGRAPENVLSPLCHMNILLPYGYETP